MVDGGGEQRQRERRKTYWFNWNGGRAPRRTSALHLTSNSGDSFHAPRQKTKLHALFRSNSADQCFISFEPKSTRSPPISFLLLQETAKGRLDTTRFCVVCAWILFISFTSHQVRALQSSRDNWLGEYERDELHNMAPQWVPKCLVMSQKYLFSLIPEWQWFLSWQLPARWTVEMRLQFWPHLSCGSLVRLWIAWTSWCCSGTGSTSPLWSWMMTD